MEGTRFLSHAVMHIKYQNDSSFSPNLKNLKTKTEVKILALPNLDIVQYYNNHSPAPRYFKNGGGDSLSNRCLQQTFVRTTKLRVMWQARDP